MTNWDQETDLLVVGSGGGSMTAALVAKLGGNEALILKKNKVLRRFDDFIRRRGLGVRQLCHS